MIHHFIIVITLFSPDFPGGQTGFTEDIGMMTTQQCERINVQIGAAVMKDPKFLENLKTIGATRMESHCVAVGQLT